MDPEQVSQMKVAELKEELKKRGLSLKGLKAELAQRLLEDVQAEALRNDQDAKDVVAEHAETTTPAASAEKIEGIDAPASGHTEAEQGGAVTQVTETPKTADGLEAAAEVHNEGTLGLEEGRPSELVSSVSPEHAVAEPVLAQSAPPPVEEKGPEPSKEEGNRKEEITDSKDLPTDIEIDDGGPNAGPAVETPSEAALPKQALDRPFESQASDIQPESTDKEIAPEGEKIEGLEPTELAPKKEEINRVSVDRSSNLKKQEPATEAKDARRESGLKRTKEEGGGAQNGDGKESRPTKLQKVDTSKAQGTHVSKPPERQDVSKEVQKVSGTSAEQDKNVRPPERVPARPAARAPEESNGETSKKREVPASARPPSRSVRVNNLVRPFHEKGLRALLSKTGTIEENGFWMDSIKTHCYVTFKSVEEAVRTREALYNVQWPPMGGRLLAVSFVPESEVESKVKGSALPSSPPATSRGGATEESGKGGPGERQRVVLPVKDRLTLPVAEKPPAAVQEPPVLSLDDLFRKTTAKPCIYWLPLTDEQVEQRRQESEKAPPGNGKAV